MAFGSQAKLPGVRDRLRPGLVKKCLGQEKLGPRIEFGSSTTVLLGLHFFNTGALSYAVLAGDDEELNFSIGGSIGLRHYFDARGAQAGPYVGGFAEYASITVTDDSDDLARYDRLVLIPAFDAGYRWVWGNFLLDLGGHLGAAFVTVAEDTPIGPSGEEDPSAGCVYADSCLEEADTMVFGMVVVDVGFFL